MTPAQKVVKAFAIALAAILTVSIFGGIFGAVGFIGGFLTDEDITGELQTYSVSSDVRDLDININAADFYVKKGETLSVESNLKKLTVTEKNGRLTVTDKTKSNLFGWSSYEGAVLTVYVPADMTFDRVSINTGAGRFTADALCAESIDLELGAGEVSIDVLTATKRADIDGGAGRVTVRGGTLRNLELDMGVGELNLTAALLGECSLDMGVGEANVNLIGSRDDYRLDIEKGIGAVSVDGMDVTDLGGSGGAVTVEISGGVGAINVSFKELEN